MDTLTFLQAILPEDGVYYLALHPVGKHYMLHRSYTDLSIMAEDVERYDKDERLTAVYHACASYKESSISDPAGELDANGNVKRKYRVEPNWGKAKAFWLDIDCGEAKAASGAGYATKKEAAVAVAKFSNIIGWPQPMLVSSGGGLHAYWPLTKAIGPKSWRKVAGLLKAALNRLDVLADPSRTADFPSILRPVGTTNRKRGAVPVTCLRPGKPATPEELTTSLMRWIKANGVEIAEQKSYDALGATPAFAATNGHDTLAGGTVYVSAPSSGAEAATKCLQMQAMRDSKGDVSLEVWRRVLGVLKHCDDGEAMAEAWTENRAATGHGQDDWRAQMNAWRVPGPATCKSFQECNPSGCVGCLHKDAITSPIMLGRYIPISSDTTEEVVDADTGTVEEVEIPVLPRGYNFESGMMVRYIKDKEGVLHPFPFTTVRFYPTMRIQDDTGAMRFGVRAHMTNKKVRDFEIPHKAVASKNDLLGALAEYEIIASNHKNAGDHMVAYLKDQLADLERRVNEINIMTSFGWKKGDNFLVGERLYHTDGQTRVVHLGGDALQESKALPAPHGTLAKYAEAINFMYARVGAEHWQYTLCAGWGSLLTPLCDSLYKGMLMAVQGGDSGKGKTTVCRASMYAFGDAEEMTINGKDGATSNAMWATVATFGSIPVLLDELTNMPAAAFSDLAYGVSRGQAKRRLTSHSGKMGLGDRASWRVSPFVTGNRDFHGLLASTLANSQAEAVRLVQINVDDYPRVPLDLDPIVEAHRVQLAVNAMRDNAGPAGEAMVKYVVANRVALEAEVNGLYEALVPHLPDQKYRFYRWHVACTMTIARVAQDLGIIEFDLDRLQEWSVDMISTLAGNVAQTNCMTAEEAFSRMVASLTPRIIRTTEFRKRAQKNGPQSPMYPIVGEIAGRYISGSSNDMAHANWLMLDLSAAKKWCDDNRKSLKELEAYLDSRGAVIRQVSGDNRQVLTRGTDLPMVQVRCLTVNMSKLDGLSLVMTTTDIESLDVEAAAS